VARAACVLYVAIGLLVLCNANWLADSALGQERLFSPIILGLCIASLFAMKTTTTKSISPETGRLALAMVAIVLVGLLPTSGMRERQKAIEYTVAWMTTCGILLTVSNLAFALARRHGNAIWVLMATYAMCLVASCSVYVGVLFPGWQKIMHGESVGRYSGFFGNPNQAAAQILLFVAVGFAMTSATGRLKWILISLATSVPALMLTSSRGGILGFAVLLIVMCVRVFSSQVSTKAIAIIAMVVVTLIGVRYSMGYIVKNRWFAYSVRRHMRDFIHFTEGRINRRTTGDRNRLAAEAIRLWKKSPLIGNGLGSLETMPRGHSGPHNVYLLLLGETGVVGLAIFLYAWLRMTPASLVKNARGVLLLGVFVSMSETAMVSDDTFFHRNHIFMLATALGLVHEHLTRYPARQKLATVVSAIGAEG